MEEKIQKTLFDKNNDKGKEKVKLDENDMQKKFMTLLQYSKVIRDPVHGDIWITETEKDIIDTPIFQRLRRLKQLGPTDLVYPGAKHTRFEHSIGTLFMAQQIIDSVNKNWHLGLSKAPIPLEDIFITRIVALIHDLANLPYGHTIEDEGNLFGKNKQWLDPDRKEEHLNKVSPVVKTNLSNLSIPSDKIEGILKDIEDILIAEEKGEEEIHNLKHPYIADIVGNTICADLLDYLKRDSYYTGLKMIYDSRILSYFVIDQYEKEGVKKPRIAILLERRKGVIRRDVLSYCLDLLKLRYSLAEKVYYHRVKSIFSAMVIKMVHCGLKGGVFTKKADLMHLGDDDLLYKIISYNKNKNEYVDASKKLGNAIRKRKLYRVIYSTEYVKEEIWNKLKKYTDKDERYNMERRLENFFSVPPGSVVIYSPKLDKGKAADTKMLRGIWENPFIKKLSELAREPEYSSTIGREIETLENLYKSLWKFYLILDSEYARDKERLRKACEEIFEKNMVGENIIRLRADNLSVEVTTTQLDEVSLELQKINVPREITGEFIDEKIKQVIGRKKANV